MSASRLTMVILCMTMSRILRSSDCHLSLAALLKLWLGPFFWNFFLGGARAGPLSAPALCGAPRLEPLRPHPAAPNAQALASSPGRAGTRHSGCGVTPQEVVDLAVPLAHDAGDGAGPRFSLR